MQSPPDGALGARLDSLSCIFTPRAIAVVGASDTPSKIGGIPVDFLKRFGYAGAIYPVNPKPGLVQGLPSFLRSLSCLATARLSVALFLSGPPGGCV